MFVSIGARARRLLADLIAAARSRAGRPPAALRPNRKTYSFPTVLQPLPSSSYDAGKSFVEVLNVTSLGHLTA